MTSRRRTRLWLALLASFVVACDDLPGRPDRSEAYVRPANVMDPEVLYATNCSGCHGEAGLHGGATALANPLYWAWAPRAAVREIVVRGVPGTPMPAFARSEGGWLEERQIDALLDGLDQRFGGEGASAGLPAYDATRGDAGRGAATFGAFCARCHGDEGTGSDGGSDVVDPAYLALVSDRALRTAIVVGRPDLGMPDWRSAGDTPMTARQIDDIVAWMAAKRPERQ